MEGQTDELQRPDTDKRMPTASSAPNNDRLPEISKPSSMSI